MVATYTPADAPDVSISGIAPSQTLSGIVPLYIKYNGIKLVERMIISIDGVTTMIFGNAGVTNYSNYKFDTTKYGNGTHEFGLQMTSMDSGAPTIVNTFLQFNSQNSNTFRQTRPSNQSIIVPPGDTGELGNDTLNCDNSRIINNTAPASNNVAVAQAFNLPVYCRKIGRAQVGGVRVNVQDPKVGIPHFSRHGKILTQYIPGESMSVRSIFGCYGNMLTPDLVAALQALGINAITTGVFINPWTSRRTMSGYVWDYTSWQRGYDGWFKQNIQPIADNGFAVLATGDEWTRGMSYLLESCGEPHDGAPANPWISQANKYTLDLLASIDTPCIDWIDEFSVVNRQGINQYHTEFRNQMLALTSIPNGWSQQVSPPTSAGDFTGNILSGLANISDFDSFYTINQDWRGTYSVTVASIPQMRQAFERTFGFSSPVRPFSMLIGWAGNAYYKKVDGDHAQPGDLITQGAWTDRSVLACCMMAAAMGCASWRAYTYDLPEWLKQRTNTLVGSSAWLTEGTSQTLGINRWNALALAFNTIGQFEDRLYGTPVASLDLGPEWMTAARVTPDGRKLFIAVQTMETSVKLPRIPTGYTNATQVSIEKGTVLGSPASFVNQLFTSGSTLLLI
jgi:hypothetical protein